MAVCPFATRRLIPPGSNDPRITPRVAILHVDAGNADSLYDYFKNRSGGIESHFHIKKSGEIEQYRDTNYQADANYQANDFAVSVETQGLEMGGWTPEQLAAIRRLLVWLRDVHGIPLRPCPGPYDAGVGYHTLFGAPSAWTPVAKSCPGPDRKRQFHDVLVPWMRRGGDGDTPPNTPPSEEDDMNLDEPLNIPGKGMKGRLETQGITVREALMASVIHIVSGRRAAKRFIAERNDKV